MEEIYDVCIIGGGPAGLTSAIYSGRYGLKTYVISKDIGGTAALADKIENYPGYEGNGFELMKKFYEQAKKFQAQFINSEVVSIKKNKNFIIELKNKDKIYSKTLIIASGTERRKLNIKGEEEFIGKGVSYCATCDGAFFRGRVVAVIGGRNSAAKAALLLSKLAKKVYIVYRQGKLNCDEVDKKRIEEKENIELVLESIPVEIKGDKFVKSLVINQKDKLKELKVDGVFVEIGSVPVSNLAKKLGIKTDEEGYILADEEMRTNINGVFAAGDIITRKLKQIIVSAAQGAIAARSAYDYLEKERKIFQD